MIRSAQYQRNLGGCFRKLPHTFVDSYVDIVDVFFSVRPESRLTRWTCGYPHATKYSKATFPFFSFFDICRLMLLHCWSSKSWGREPLENIECRQQGKLIADPQLRRASKSGVTVPNGRATRQRPRTLQRCIPFSYVTSCGTSKIITNVLSAYSSEILVPVPASEILNSNFVTLVSDPECRSRGNTTSGCRRRHIVPLNGSKPRHSSPMNRPPYLITLNACKGVFAQVLLT